MIEKYPNQNDITKLREMFNFDKLKTLSRPLVGENFVLEEEEFSTLLLYKLIHQEVTFWEKQQIIFRNYYFKSEEAPSTIHLRIALCMRGYQDALEFLFSFVENFQKEPVILKRVQNTAEGGIGDFGIAWSFLPTEIGNVGFIRNNLLITIELNHQIQYDVFEIAEEIDQVLKKLKTVEKYVKTKDGIFTEIKQKFGETPKVVTGETLRIGSISTTKTGKDYAFFTTTGGSINQDIRDPKIWYYRAGLKKGLQKIMLYRANSGILPVIESLNIEITSGET